MKRILGRIQTKNFLQGVSENTESHRDKKF
jgi:hypothetical protein